MGVSVVLGAGGLRGVGHVAFLKSLSESDIVVDEVIGSSAGAVMGSVYASDGDLDEVRDVFEDVWDVLTSWDRSSLYPLDKALVSDQLESLLGSTRFDELSTDLSVTYFDAGRDEEVVQDDGDVKDAVLRSMAIPGLMNDVDGSVDGGFWSPLPLHVAAEGKDVIACDVAPPLSLARGESFSNALTNLYTLGQVRLVSLQKELYRERSAGHLSVCRPVQSEYTAWDVEHVEDMYDEACSRTAVFFDDVVS